MEISPLEVSFTKGPPGDVASVPEGPFYLLQDVAFRYQRPPCRRSPLRNKIHRYQQHDHPAAQVHLRVRPTFHLVHKTPYRLTRYGVSFCLSLQNRASFVLTAQSDVCRTFRHNVHSFTRSFVKNDNSPIRSTQPPNGCLFKVRFPPTRSTHRERMTLKFFKLLQRYIKNDLDIIVASDTDFLDELVEDCLPLLKGCVLIGACPCEQIAAIIFSFLVFLLNLLQLVLCSGQGILCCLAEKIRFRTSSAVYPSCTCRCRWCSWDKRTAASPGSFAGLSLPTR